MTVTRLQNIYSIRNSPCLLKYRVPLSPEAPKRGYQTLLVSKHNLPSEGCQNSCPATWQPYATPHTELLRSPWCETGACLISIQKKMQNRCPFQSTGKMSVLKRLIKLTLKYSLIIKIQLKDFIVAFLQTLCWLSSHPLTSPIPAPWLEYFLRVPSLLSRHIYVMDSVPYSSLEDFSASHDMLQFQDL